MSGPRSEIEARVLEALEVPRAVGDLLFLFPALKESGRAAVEAAIESLGEACAARKLRRRRSGRVFVFVYESVASAGSKHSDRRWWSLGWGVGGCRRPLFE